MDAGQQRPVQGPELIGTVARARGMTIGAASAARRRATRRRPGRPARLRRGQHACTAPARRCCEIAHEDRCPDAGAVAARCPHHRARGRAERVEVQGRRQGQARRAADPRSRGVAHALDVAGGHLEHQVGALQALEGAEEAVGPRHAPDDQGRHPHDRDLQGQQAGRRGEVVVVKQGAGCAVAIPLDTSPSSGSRANSRTSAPSS